MGANSQKKVRKLERIAAGVDVYVAHDILSQFGRFGRSINEVRQYLKTTCRLAGLKPVAGLSGPDLEWVIDRVLGKRGGYLVGPAPLNRLSCGALQLQPFRAQQEHLQLVCTVAAQVLLGLQTAHPAIERAVDEAWRVSRRPRTFCRQRVHHMALAPWRWTLDGLLAGHYDLNAVSAEHLTKEQHRILGTLYADGCVYLGPNGEIKVSMTCRPVDKARLDEVASFFRMQPSAVTPYTTKAGELKYQLHISSPVIVAFALLWGLVPRKGKTGTYVQRGLHLSRDFWRGAFDGDASIATRNDPSGLRFRMTSCPQGLAQLVEFATRHGISLPTDSHGCVRIKPAGGAARGHQLDFCGQVRRAMARLIYPRNARTESRYSDKWEKAQTMY